MRHYAPAPSFSCACRVSPADYKHWRGPRTDSVQHTPPSVAVHHLQPCGKGEKEPTTFERWSARQTRPKSSCLPTPPCPVAATTGQERMVTAGSKGYIVGIIALTVSPANKLAMARTFAREARCQFASYRPTERAQANPQAWLDGARRPLPSAKTGLPAKPPRTTLRARRPLRSIPFRSSGRAPVPLHCPWRSARMRGSNIRNATLGGVGNVGNIVNTNAVHSLLCQSTQRVPELTQARQARWYSERLPYHCGRGNSWCRQG